MNNVLRIAAFFVATLIAPVVTAQPYPSKLVRILVPAGPGGSNSIIARIISQRLQENLGQAFIVDNRGGAGGRLATDFVAKSAPDGYTLLLTYGGPISTGLALFNSLPYDAARDFAPIAIVAEVPIVMVAGPKFPAQTVKDVITYARENPGKLSASINSYGSMGHLLTEEFRLDNDIKINSIPYKGTGEAMTDMLGGRIDIAFDTVAALTPLIKDGRLRALAIASSTRSDALPQVPTFSELGINGMEATVWFALLAPAGTPKEIIDRLSDATSKVMQTSQVRELLTKQGIVPRFTSVADTTDFIKRETEKWTKIINDSGMEKQ